MNNFPNCKTFSEYKKKFCNIMTNDIGIPNLFDRVVIVETVNTGPKPKGNNIIEISCMEMMGGKITGFEFDAFLHPRYSINEVTKQKTNLNNNFYDEYYKDVYASDKMVLEQFKKFIGQSKIVSYNSNKEIEFINNELIFHKMSIFQKNKFYNVLNIIKQMFPLLNQGIFSLNKCCDFLEIKLPKEKYHSSKSDCFSVAKIISKLYDIIKDEQYEKENQKVENNENENENNKISEKSQNFSSSGIKSEKSEKNSEIDFDYTESIIDIIEEENRNNKNRNENIINNKKRNKAYIDKNDRNNSDKFDYNYELNEKNDKFLNNKRNFGEFDDLMKNLKSKVSPDKKEEYNEVKNIGINLDENEFQQIENELLQEKLKMNYNNNNKK